MLKFASALAFSGIGCIIFVFIFAPLLPTTNLFFYIINMAFGMALTCLFGSLLAFIYYFNIMDRSEQKHEPKRSEL